MSGEDPGAGAGPSPVVVTAEDIEKLSEKAARNARLAIEADRAGDQVDFAYHRYIDAIEALRLIALSTTNPDVMSRLEQYLTRAEALHDVLMRPQTLKTPQQLLVEQIRSMLTEAMDEDEGGSKKKALELYSEVLNFAGDVINGRSTSGSESALVDESTKEELNKYLRIAYTRECDLKADQAPFDSHPTNSQAVVAAAAAPDSAKFSPEELKVLEVTSKINNQLFVPFMPHDINERFSFRQLFRDPDGLLELNDKMKSQLHKWVRPSEIMSTPQMIIQISPYSLKQTVVPNCSFVSALTVSANYEKRFKKQLITSIIFPQKKKQPIYNPSGKYMVKLHFNGCRRKVVVDDLLPYSKHEELMCARSTNRNELWVSIVEKAFLKVMGGYNFPGSNSSADLFVLTGWIPERYSLADPSALSDKTPEEFFDMVHRYFNQGNCLLNFGTGTLTSDQEEQIGLVSQHGYACLSLANHKGLRLAQLKNPWARFGWKGKFSRHDSTSWTPEMKVALKFDPTSSKYVDNGVFWIDFNSMKRYFDSCSVSWNPEFFPHRLCFHKTWRSDDGPRKTKFSLSRNPQYVLTMNVNQPQITVWLVLSRHITQKKDFADNNVYMGLEVFKNGGRKMFYNEKPMLRSVQSNAMNTLVKLRETKQGIQKYTIAVCQYDKTEDLHYTLRVYSIVPIDSMREIPTLPHNQTLTSKWDESNAGGPHGKPPNPAFKIELSANCGSTAELVIELKASKTFGIFLVLENLKVHHRKTPKFQEIYPAHSAMREYRQGYFVFSEVVQTGVYKLIPSTYQPGLTGPFIIEASSSVPFSLCVL